MLSFKDWWALRPKWLFNHKDKCVMILSERGDRWAIFWRGDLYFATVANSDEFEATGGESLLPQYKTGAGGHENNPDNGR